MKNHIRGFVILLLSAVLLSVACGQTQTLACQQTDTVLHETYQDRAEVDFSTAVDSLQFRHKNLQQEMMELKATFFESVPASQAQMTIPTQSLIELPEGAKYGISDGRGTIILTGRCDIVGRKFSIHAQDSKRVKMILEIASNAAHTTLKTETKLPPNQKGRWFATGSGLGVMRSAGLPAIWKKFSVGTLTRGKGFITKIR